MKPQRHRFYEFGNFRLDVGERTLSREGAFVSLTPKAFETLLVLVENSGRVMEKDELMRRLWPDTFVEEANLAVNVSSLRKILGEPPGGGQYIETIPRRGYRFIAPVSEILDEPTDIVIAEHTKARLVVTDEEDISDKVLSDKLQPPGEQPSLVPAPTPHTSRMRWVALTLGLVVIALGAALTWYLTRKPESGTSAHPRTLAILPFRNLKPDPETEFLGFSLANEVITKLYYVSSVVVRPSESVQRYRNQEIDLAKVASELNVDAVLTATYLKEGDTLRITAQLIDVRNGNRLLWNQPSKDWKVDKWVTIHDQVAQQIVRGLELSLTSAEEDTFGRSERAGAQAYELFLRGLYLYQTNRFAAAIQSLEDATRLEPDFAEAWAHLGRAYSANAAFQLAGQADYKKALDCYRRAIDLNPKQIDARIFMANMLTDTGQVEQAVPLLRDVLQTNQNLAEAHWELGYAYRFAGMLEESITECERARVLDPEVKLYSSALNSYLYYGDYDKFLKSLPETNIGFIVFYRGLAHYYKQNFSEAADEFDRAYELDRNLYTRIGKALSLGIRNQKERATSLLLETRQMMEERGVNEAEALYKVAQAYAVLGDKETAISLLERSIESGFFCYPYFVNDPLLENIRNESEFRAPIDKARLRREEFRKRFF